MNRTDRLVAMMTYLQGRRVVRAEELAEHFEISLRTVYRDIAALGEAGVPVVGEAGVGYTLVKGYHLPPVMFTSEEAMALAVAKDLVKRFTDPSLATPMATALLKIRSVLPRDQQDALDRLARSTAIEGCALGQSHEEPRMLLPIQQAILARRLLRLRYRTRERQESDRFVEPLGVVHYGQAWYLVGWCRLRQNYRHFKIGRIVGAEILNERFDHRPEFSLAEHLREARGAEKGIEVKLRITDPAMERARTETFAGFTTEHREPDGTWQVTLMAYSYPWITRWVMSFGGEIEVVEPVELKAEITTAARTLAERHQDCVFS